MAGEGDARPRVGFLVAGVQKGGTTALYDYLVEHPALLMADVKETHFFDDESRDWGRPDYGAYHAMFTPPSDGRPRLWGEATPIYAYWPGSLERIAAYNPDIRLILVFRDPIDRAWSHWKMEYARGAETRPFAWCIREGRARVETDPSAPGFHRVYSYVERGFYGAQVQRLLGLFRREQLLFLRSGDLKTQPGRILGKVCDFLNAPALPGLQIKESHVAKDIDYGQIISQDDRDYLARQFAEDQRNLFSLTGIRFQ